MNRIVIGGIVGGVVMFFWGFVAHTLLPIGEMGISRLANEDAIIAAFADSGVESGLYVVPSLPEGEPTDEEMEAVMAKAEAGPMAFLAYSKDGTPGMTVQLITQFVSDVLAALIAAMVIAKLATYGARLLGVTMMGVFAWLAISVPHWTWYRFPTEFLTAELLEQGIGWFAAGIVIAGIAKPPSE